MKDLINKIRSHHLANYIFALLAIIMLFIFYQMYVWANTQSTDNSYVEAEISNISPEVNGVIEHMYVAENSLVKKGQIIAKIKDDDYQANYKKSQAGLESAMHDIAMIKQNIKLTLIEKEKAQDAFEFAETNFKIIERDYSRTMKLSLDNFASKQKLDNTKIAFEKAKNDLSQAKLNTQTSHENLAMLEIKLLASQTKLETLKQENILAKTMLNNTNICSPIDGVVGNNSAKIGNYVRIGFILFSVVPLHDLYIKANFKETQISKFKTGMPVSISFDSEPGVKIIGKIRNISPATGAKFSLLPPSNATGNFTKIVQRVPVTIDFDLPTEQYSKIVPGMSTIVKIRTD